MAPHKSCCGCCCNLEIGAPVGVVLLLLLYILQAVLSSIAASAMSASYQLDAAKAFCFKTTKGYRDGYAYCYTDNVCTGHDGMDSLYSKSTAANTMFIIGSWLSVLALVYTLTATLKRTEQGPLAVHHSWKLLLFFPCWHFLAAIVNAALAAKEVQFMTAVEFYERAAADRHCNQVPLGTSDLPFIEGFKTGDVDCAEYKDVGVPDRSDQAQPRAPSPEPNPQSPIPNPQSPIRRSSEPRTPSPSPPQTQHLTPCPHITEPCPMRSLAGGARLDGQRVRA